MQFCWDQDKTNFYQRWMLGTWKNTNLNSPSPSHLVYFLSNPSLYYGMALMERLTKFKVNETNSTRTNKQTIHALVLTLVATACGLCITWRALSPRWGRCPPSQPRWPRSTEAACRASGQPLLQPHIWDTEHLTRACPVVTRPAIRDNIRGNRGHA